MKLWYILLPMCILLFTVMFFVQNSGKLGTVKTAAGKVITKWKIKPPSWQNIKRILTLLVIAFFIWQWWPKKQYQTLYFKKGQDYKTVYLDLRPFHWEVQGGVLCGFNGKGERMRLGDWYQNFYGPEYRVMKLKVESGDDVVMTLTYKD